MFNKNYACNESQSRINNFLQIVSKISPMWFALYLNLICNLCSCYLKKKKKFTSVVCSCLAFRDLLTESITIDEYLFSLSPSKFNCNALLCSILQNKAQTKFHSFTYQRGGKEGHTNRVEHDKSKARGIPKLAQNMVNTIPLVVFGVECPYPVNLNLKLIESNQTSS